MREILITGSTTIDELESVLKGRNLGLTVFHADPCDSPDAEICGSLAAALCSAIEDAMSSKSEH